MPNKPKFMRDAADRAVADLLADYEQTGERSRELLAAKAEEASYSERHLKRLLDRAIDGEPLRSSPTFEITELVVTAVFVACGRLETAYRHLHRKGVELPSLRHFTRCVRDELGTDQIAYAKRGSKGFRDAQAYLSSRFPHRMHTVQLDHSELPIWVVPRGYQQAHKPWITSVMDAKSRYILGYAITFGRPTSEQVRAALASAMTLRYAPDGETLVGGRPLKAVWDRGLEFVSNLITESCLRLGVMPIALPGYSPHLKGRKERFYGFFKTDCLAPLPGYDDGPTDLRGNSSIAKYALNEDEFLRNVDEWMDWYVTEHRIEGKETPLERWRRDATPLREVTPEQLWVDMLMAKDKCKVSKNGIRFDRIDWTAPEVTGIVGRKVEIRYLPHDRSFIEVFLDGDHLFTAWPKETLTADEEEAVKRHRVAQRRLAQNRGTVANRTRRASAEDGVHKLEVDRHGNRHVVSDDLEDILDGPDITIDDLVQLSHDNSQGSLFA